MVDPDPRVSGYGLRYLRDNGVVVNVAEEEEAALCRQLNAPFVFRVVMERAYSVVLTSVNQEGAVCDSFFKDLSEAGASFKSPSADSSEDLAALLQQLAPEINAIVLTSSQFLSIHPSVLNSLPSHIAVAVTVSSSDSELSSDILQVPFTPFILPPRPYNILPQLFSILLQLGIFLFQTDYSTTYHTSFSFCRSSREFSMFHVLSAVTYVTVTATAVAVVALLVAQASS